MTRAEAIELIKSAISHSMLNGFSASFESALDLAIADMKRNMPMKPIMIQPINRVCPSCKVATLHPWERFCPECGQAIRAGDDK